MATHRVLGPPAARTAHAPFLPSSPEEYAAVHAQLERILSSSVFRNSKRYASVLKYVVERTVEGAGDQLKERTIGIEVFGRVPDYDTASDHAVRSAAAEIRKRLAQYYQEDANRAELRIELQPGSYVPQFRWPYQDLPEHSVDASTKPKLGAVVLTVAQNSVWPKMRTWIAGLGVVVLVGVVAAVLLARADDPIDQFWGALLSAKGEVLI